jgi:hypothetical protein
MTTFLWICFAWFSFSAVLSMLLIVRNKAEPDGIRALRCVLMLYEAAMAFAAWTFVS